MSFPAHIPDIGRGGPDVKRLVEIVRHSTGNRDRRVEVWSPILTMVEIVSGRQAEPVQFHRQMHLRSLAAETAAPRRHV
jgi:hypothetical protein